MHNDLANMFSEKQHHSNYFGDMFNDVLPSSVRIPTRPEHTCKDHCPGRLVARTLTKTHLAPLVPYYLYTAAQATLRGKARSLAAAASALKRADKARSTSSFARMNLIVVGLVALPQWSFH